MALYTKLKQKDLAQSMDYSVALQCAYLAHDIYRDFSKIAFRGWSGASPKLIENRSSDTQLAILEDSTSQMATIVFRGSNAGRDWGTNLNAGHQAYEWSRKEKKEYKQQLKQMGKSVAGTGELIYPEAYGKASGPVKMHRGFVNAYLSVRDEIHTYVNNSQATRYRIVGHSLGGALAKLCAVDLQYNFGAETTAETVSETASKTDEQGKGIAVETYTFGAPRAGNKAFVASYNKRVPQTWRIVNGWDAVCSLPHVWQGYRHADRVVKLKRRFTWRVLSTRIADHFMTGYIKSLETLVKQLAQENTAHANSLEEQRKLAGESFNPRLAK